jgi:hypothetical protein
MFQSIDQVGFASNEYQTAYWLIDTEFNESFGVMNTNGDDDDLMEHFKKIIENIVDIYKRRSYNVPYNLALYIHSRAIIPFKEGLDEEVQFIYQLYPQYKNDIEKYLMLI